MGVERTLPDMRAHNPDPLASEAARFNRLWVDYADRVLAYALRHTDRDDAQEVVSETFLIAWRRLASVPGDPLPWLLVVARNTLANQRRSGYRRAALSAELSRLTGLAAAPSAGDLVTERSEVLAALAALSPKEREALLLVAWDGLAPAAAAQVAGCTVSAFNVRLFRARRRLERPPEPHRVTARPALAPGSTA